MSLAATESRLDLGLPEFATLVSLDAATLERYWNLLKDNKLTFMEGAASREQFERHMFGESVLIDIPGCLIFLQQIWPKCRLEVHLAVHDKRLSNKTEMLREMLQWAFLQFDLNRVETFVRMDYHAVAHFITKRLGFKFEGILRSRGLTSAGRAIDVRAYSILRDEVM